MRKYFFSNLDFVQLFGEGGGAAAGDGGAQGAAGTTPAGQETAALAQPQQKGVKSRNPLADVQYGKPTEETGAPAAAEQPAALDRAAQFEAMIKGEYKDLYDKRIQDTISKRLKGNEETVKQYKALEPVLPMLSKFYGVNQGDAEALRKAIEADNQFYEQEAMDSGLTVEQVRERERMKRENEQLRRQVETISQKEAVDRQYNAWLQEADKVKQVYPSFDLATESKNEQFAAMLRSGVSMQAAFEVIHKDEIIPAAMQFASKQATEKVANAVLAGQRRPQEGAMASRASTLRKTDVTQLTRADRDEIERRVARGEKIRF